MTLPDFLLARIADQEMAARSAFAEFSPATRESWLRWVAADCQAKRDIVDHGDETVLRILAAVYATHPDYREEWRVYADS